MFKVDPAKANEYKARMFSKKYTALLLPDSLGLFENPWRLRALLMLGAMHCASSRRKRVLLTGV
jgi:hypothetical protein